MTPTETLSALQSIIYERIPSLKELTFGCEVEYPDYNNRLQVIEYDSRSDSVWVRESDKDNCFEKVEKVKIYDIEILGHPITLADVLRVIRMLYGNMFIDERGNFVYVNRKKFEYNYAFHEGHNARWDLSKDLSGQSPETIEWLLSLLTK